MGETVIKIDNLKKKYRLGTIGGATLNAELQSWWARKRGKEDPNLRLGEEQEDINVTFWALNGINLEVERGEALGIIGANGAGKSTLLKILSRVTAPTEGEIWIKGRISSMLEVGTGFHGELTGRENIYMNGAILGMTKKEVDIKMESIIEFSECQQFIDTPVKRYSSGMYVKLAFAVAANLDADILVMDEVLAVGDMKFQKKCLGKMGDVANNEGKTVLYVSHNMNTVRSLCTRCIVLNKGQIAYDGDVETAIQIYLENNKEDLKTIFDTSKDKRPLYDLGKKGCIDFIQLLNKESARYDVCEKMLIKVKWRMKCCIDKVKLGFSLKYADGTNIGFTETDASFDVTSGNDYETILEYNLSNLAEGVYFIYLQLFYLDELNIVHGIDQSEKIFIEIIDNDPSKTSWQRQYWGSIRLNTLKIIKKGINDEDIIFK